MTAYSKVAVLIAHDHPLLSAGLAAAFGAGDEFEVTADIATLLAHAAGLVVADFDNGVRLALAHPALPVMIVSHEDGEAAIRQAIESGVRGYLLPASPIGSIIHCARTLLRGGLDIDPLAISKIMASLNAEQLTKRELEVLSLLMQGLTDKQMANRLGNTVGTIKCHVKQLRSKLNAKSRTEAILIAQRRGLLPREAPGSRGVAPRQPRLPPLGEVRHTRPGVVAARQRPEYGYTEIR